MSIKKNGIYWKGIKRRIGKFFEKVHECILTQLSQMGKLKNLKKLEKLKPYVLQLNLQPKRLLAITSNDRRE